MLLLGLSLVAAACAQVVHPRSTAGQAGEGAGTGPHDFDVIGPELEVVHQSDIPPTGVAVDQANRVYIAYPRNGGPRDTTLAIVTGPNSVEPWPNADWQKCAPGQNPSTCFVSIHAAVIDSVGRLWAVDTGIPWPNNGEHPISGGAKFISFNVTTRKPIRSYVIPDKFLHPSLNINDIVVNATLGKAGTAFLADETKLGSIVTIDLATGQTSQRLLNSTVTRADDGFVGIYNGEPKYVWKGTNKSYVDTGADGIAAASGNLYWSVLGSRRYYYVPQTVLADFSKSDADVAKAVVSPGQCGTEQAGLTADDRGRLYITASEHNAIFYVDTRQSEVKEEINGVAPGGAGLVRPEDYVLKTLVRSALVQHADTLAIRDGWLYITTNQLGLSPSRQYMNVDKRKPPFPIYRLKIEGRESAV